MHGLKGPMAWCPHQYCKDRSITPAVAFGGQWLRHTDKVSHAFHSAVPLQQSLGCELYLIDLSVCLVLSVAHCLAINEIKHRRQQ